MSKTILGALTLLTVALSQANAQHQWGSAGGSAASVPSRQETAADPQRAPIARDRINSVSDVTITEGHIARLRAALKLTPMQQQYWAPVEAALNQIARQQARAEVGTGYRLADRTSAIATTLMQLQRLRSVAMPLIYSLDENQKREAIAFARTMGFQQLVAAF